MLSRFRVINYALLDEVTIEFTPGLNIITGETGAGKSILMDALGLILGARATTDAIRTGAESACIEGLFEWTPGAPPVLPDATSLSEDGMLILRREITRDGRNRCAVNGQLATVAQLKRLGEVLVDLHGQHDHQSLLNPRTHIEFLDGFGDARRTRERVADLYRRYAEIAHAIRRVDADIAAAQERRDLYAFQAEELRAANVSVGEDEALERERDILEHAEHLIHITSNASDALSQQEHALVDVLGQVTRTLEDAARIDPSLDEAVAGCRSARYQLQEIALFLQQYQDRIEYDPQRLAEVLDRLNLLKQLKKKYGATLADVCVHRDRITAELGLLDSSDTRRAALVHELDTARTALTQQAKRLSDLRRKVATRLEARVVEELAELGMPRTRFRVQIEWVPMPDGPILLDGHAYHADASGMDRVEFLISPNPGEDLKPLAQIASGGEMARIMLALKVILAEVDQIPTLVFDEIDIGISGRIGESIGQKLKTLAQTHQVLCITHLHQVACWGDAHFVVRKQSTRGRTVTQIRPLDDEGRVQEIARMLAGETIDDLAVTHAREMLRRAAGDPVLARK